MRLPGRREPRTLRRALAAGALRAVGQTLTLVGGYYFLASGIWG